MATLIVRHLPNLLSEEERKEFLKYFGAESIRCMSDTGALKHVAFATFSSPASAQKALTRLHQLEILGSRLVVEFAKDRFSFCFPTSEDRHVTEDAKDGEDSSSAKNINETEANSMIKFFKSLHSSINGCDDGYPISPMILYKFPPASPFIIQNIVQALLSVPKFYIQVLHLMNKMNLPAPFTTSSTQPLLPSVYYDHRVGAPHDNDLDDYDMDEESEMESDNEPDLRTVENVQRNILSSKKKRPRKKPRLDQLLPPTDIKPKSREKHPIPTDVFDSSDTSKIKPIEFNLKTKDYAKESKGSEIVTVVEGGFGKIQPVVENVDDETNFQDESIQQLNKYISDKELKESRISADELPHMSAFKNYQAGDPTTRLYLKNLSKQVGEMDLLYIYGRYVEWDSEEEKNIFDIRLMKEGRMKGQAFITLADEIKSKKAVTETNGYLLYGRPVVVQFARSAKPKEKPDKL